jgi:hypothetical protein
MNGLDYRMGSRFRGLVLPTDACVFRPLAGPVERKMTDVDANQQPQMAIRSREFIIVIDDSFAQMSIPIYPSSFFLGKGG